MNFTEFILTRDINGYNGFGLPFSVNNYNVTLAANTDTTTTVPNGCQNYIAIFSYQQGSSVWVALNQTAAKPVGGTFAATSSTLNPTARSVKANDVIHCLTGDTSAQVSVTFYAIPTYQRLI